MPVEVTAAAQLELGELEEALALPDNTRAELIEAMQTPARFPSIGRSLPGRWAPLQAWPGPSNLVCVYEVVDGVVRVVSIRHTKSLQSPFQPGSHP